MTARAETTDSPIVVSWKSKNYKVIPTKQWSIEVLEAMEDGKMTYILRNILEGDGYQRFRDTKPLASEVGEFFEKIQKAIAPGN